MLGWEFPPFISGGLGTACYGLTKAMDQLGIKVTFVLPKILDSEYAAHVKLLSPDARTSAAAFKSNKLENVTFRTITSALQPYSTPDAYRQAIERKLAEKHGGNIGLSGQSIGAIDYSGNMHTEVHRYAAVAARLDDLPSRNCCGTAQRQTFCRTRAFNRIRPQRGKYQPDDLRYRERRYARSR
jgi:hypothetical protein